MAPHSSTLAWKIPRTEEPGRLQSMGSLRVGQLHFHFSLSCIGEGNGNPLQYSCLENPRDRGAQWAAVYGVAQSRTRLKWLSSSSSSSFVYLLCCLHIWCYIQEIFAKPNVRNVFPYDLFQKFYSVRYYVYVFFSIFTFFQSVVKIANFFLLHVVVQFPSSTF